MLLFKRRVYRKKKANVIYACENCPISVLQDIMKYEYSRRIFCNCFPANEQTKFPWLLFTTFTFTIRWHWNTFYRELLHRALLNVILLLVLYRMKLSIKKTKKKPSKRILKIPFEIHIGNRCRNNNKKNIQIIVKKKKTLVIENQYYEYRRNCKTKTSNETSRVIEISIVENRYFSGLRHDEF